MFATSSDELLTVFRREVDDAVAPYLWADAEIFGYMTEAFDAVLDITEVATKVLSLPYVAGTPTVALPAKLLQIRSAHIDGRPVTQKNAGDRMSGGLDDYGRTLSGSDEMFNSSGEPEFYVRDYNTKALRLVPIPNANGTLEVQCVVTLGQPMEEGAVLPTTHTQDLRAALHYMKHLGYQKHDSATEDLERAQFHLDHFKRMADERKQRLHNDRRAPGFIRIEW